jgi:hypothetical protein
MTMARSQEIKRWYNNDCIYKNFVKLFKNLRSLSRNNNATYCSSANVTHISTIRMLHTPGLALQSLWGPWPPHTACAAVLLRHTVGLLWTSHQSVVKASTNTGQHNIQASCGIRTQDPSVQADKTCSLDRAATGTGMLGYDMSCHVMLRTCDSPVMNICSLCKTRKNQEWKEGQIMKANGKTRICVGVERWSHLAFRWTELSASCFDLQATCVAIIGTPVSPLIAPFCASNRALLWRQW